MSAFFDLQVYSLLTWLDDRVCCECGLYLAPDQAQCESAVCVCSECGETKQHYDFQYAKREKLSRTARCEQCLKAEERREEHGNPMRFLED